MRYAAAVRPGEFVLQNRISSKKFRRQTVDLIGFGAGFLLPFCPKGGFFRPADREVCVFFRKSPS